MQNYKYSCPVIAITGNMGSGKSTVAKIFEEQGAYIVDADRRATKLLWNDDTIHQQVIDAYGTEICGTDGRISREKLRKIVFQSKKSSEKLNRIIHPELRKRYWKDIDQKAQSGIYKMIGVDAALIFESGTENLYDFIVTVAADKDQMIERVRMRDPDVADVLLRGMDIQMAQDEKIKKSHFVIYNNSTIHDLENQSLPVFESVLHKFECNKTQ